jgi:two-component system sensor histidine kinase DegS
MVSVRLSQQPETLRLEVCDNGRGTALKQLESRDAFGLRSMRERATLWDGTVEIHGNPGKGTKVVVRMPSGLSHGKEEINDAYSRR